MKITSKANVNVCINTRKKKARVTIVAEAPLTIVVNGEEYLSLVSTPDKEKELCIGVLKTQNVIESYSNIRSMKFNRRKREINVRCARLDLGARGTGRREYLISGFAAHKMNIPFYQAQFLPQVRSPLSYPVSRMYRHMNEVNEKAKVFRKTGGVHSAGLYKNGRLLRLCEDIGRHNTVSKLVGYALMNGIDLSETIVISSGRISSEIVLKIARAGVPILASRSCPTSAALNIARKTGVTLIGFMRGNKCTIYCGEERIRE